jgi:hypothetical protein
VKRRTLPLSVALWSLIGKVWAAGAMYDDATLNVWGERYQRSTTRILDEVIWPKVLDAERQRFGGKPRLLFPRGDPASPLLFYHPAHQPTVVMPLLSLKFLDDLCTAYAWLQIRGYDIASISEYTAILAYSQPPPGGFPPPLKALGIPGDALADSEVDELALGHFVTARMFILLHEMGHIYFDHAATDFAQSVRNEEQADSFAATVMQRTPLPPLGILVFFMADASWSGYGDRARATHPMTGARLIELADHVDRRSLAKQLRKLGALIDDPDIRSGFITSGKAGDLQALGPRRPGQLPNRAALASAGTQSGIFNGTYRGMFTQQNDQTGGPIPVEIQLERQGDRVTGRYSFGLGIGSIEGRVAGQRLRFNWTWAGNYGRGTLDATQDGGFTGTWGYREADRGAGTWEGSPTR